MEKSQIGIIAGIVCAVVLIVVYLIVMGRVNDSKKVIGIGKLFIEALVVGAGLVAVSAGIHAATMAVTSKEFSMGHGGLAIQVFFAGMLFHYLFEVTTGNHWYCSSRLE